MQDRLAARDVAYGHWTFLRILWQDDGLSVTELARRAGVAKPAAVTALHAMEKRGYVARGQRDGNQKTVYVGLTPLGRELEDVLVPLALEVNELALRGTTPRQQAAFRKMLAHVIRNLEGG